MNASPVTPRTPFDSNTFVSAAYPLFDRFQFTMTEHPSDDIAVFILSLLLGSGTNMSSRIAARIAVRNAADALNVSPNPLPGKSSSRP